VNESTPNEPSKVPNTDNASIRKITCSDKLDNKQNNKLIKSDSDLDEILAVWPELPEHIKQAIMVLVRSV